MIVDDVGEMVRGEAIAFHKDLVVDRLVVESHDAAHHVPHARRARGHLQPNNVRVAALDPSVLVFAAARNQRNGGEKRYESRVPCVRLV